MTQQSALELYRHFVAVINAAETERNIFAIEKAALAMGMSGSERPSGTSQRWDYTYVDERGDTLVVHARYWDQSKSFSSRPDMHVMSAVLVERGKPLVHEKRYEG